MKEQFTPGPWKIFNTRISSNGIHIAECSIGKKGVPYIQVQGEEQANATLIAAAPGMYEALMNIMKNANNILSSIKDPLGRSVAANLRKIAVDALSKANPQ